MKIRSIHPEFFTDTRISRLSYPARILYQGLWCRADDEGRGRNIPKAIEGDVFPHDLVDIVGLMQELARLRVIRFYEVDGEQFYEVPAWDRWQKPRYKSTKLNPTPDKGRYLPVDSDDGQNRLELLEVSESLAESGAKSGLIGQEKARGEGVGEGVGEGAAAHNSFQVFHSQRARDVVQKKAAAGYPVKSKNGLAITLAGDPDFVVESKRIWAHRDCGKCAGSGFTSVYAPGSGSRKVECGGTV